jgi:hypothetical protein
MKKILVLGGFLLGGFFIIKKIYPRQNKNKSNNSKDPSKYMFEETKVYDVKEWKDPNKLTRREYIDKYY